MNKLTIAGIMIFVMAMVVFAITLYLTATKIIKPIKNITGILDVFSSGNLSVNAPEDILKDMINRNMAKSMVICKNHCNNN